MGNSELARSESYCHLTAVGIPCDEKALSVPSAFSLAEGLSRLKIWHFSLTLNLNIQWQKGKGVFQLPELGVCVAAPSAGHLCLWWCQAMVFWGCVHRRVLIQTAEGAAFWAGGRGGWGRDVVGQDVRWVYSAEKQSWDVRKEESLDGCWEWADVGEKLIQPTRIKERLS